MRQTPTIGEYRGVPLHADQDETRLSVVRRALDAVFEITEVHALLTYAAYCGNPPEARGLAVAKCEAVFNLSVENRTARPPVDLEFLSALRTIIGARRNPRFYCSIYEPIGPSAHARPVARDRPLAE